MIKVQRNSKGFTLIELLIVIAIIGILAAIAIPAYTGYTKKAKVSGVVSAMGAVKNAIAAYYTESGAAGPDAATIAAVASTYGVDPPIQYIAANTGMTVASAGGTTTITSTLANIGSGVDTMTLTLFTTDFKGWTWGGTLDMQYRPKQ